VAVFDNRFTNNGAAPDNDIGELVASISGTPVPDIVWDGNMPLWHYFTGIPENRGVYIGDNAGSDPETGKATFIDLDVIAYFTWSWFHAPSRDYPAHAGSVARLAGASLPDAMMGGEAE